MKDYEVFLISQLFLELKFFYLHSKLNLTGIHSFNSYFNEKRKNQTDSGIDLFRRIMDIVNMLQ